jgi:CBS domain-containing protein
MERVLLSLLPRFRHRLDAEKEDDFLAEERSQMNGKSTLQAARVEDVMTANPICVSGDMDVQELARVFDENEVSGAPVVDGQDRLIGVVSRTDVLHRCLEGPPGARPGSSFLQSLDEVTRVRHEETASELGTVDDFMTTDVVTAKPDESVRTVAHRMAQEKVHRIVVVDGQRQPLGVVTTLDVLRVFPETNS